MLELFDELLLFVRGCEFIKDLYLLVGDDVDTSSCNHFL